VGFTVHDTLIPDAVLDASNWIVVGTGSFVTALTDASDATFGAQATYPGPGLEMSLSDSSALPSYAQISGLRLKTRMQTGSSPGFIGLGIRSDAGDQAYSVTVWPVTATDYEGPVWARRVDGAAWTLADVQNLRLLALGVGGGVRLIKASVEVLINNAPVTVAVSPTGTITTTTRPVYLWSFSDSDGDSEERVGIKLYSGTGAVANFDDSSDPRLLWDSGAIFTSGLTYKQPFPLDAAAGYRWAVHAMDVGSGSWGPWASQTFTTSITPPSAPTALFDYVPADQALLIRPSPGGGATTEFYVVERSDDGGVTYHDVLRGTFHDGNLTADEAGFETSTAGWIANVGITGSPARSSAQAFAGSWSLASTVSGSVGSVYLPTHKLASPGINYQFLCRFRAATSGASAYLSVVWFDRDGVPIRTDDAPAVTDTTGGWTTQTFIAPAAPIGTWDYVLYVHWSGATAGSVHYIDDLGVTPRLTDYAAPRRASSVGGGFTYYRIRAAHVLAYTSAPVEVSEYVLSAPLVTGVTPQVGDCTTRLKHPYEPSLNMAIVDNANLTSTSTEDMAVQGASNRPDWAVFRGTVRLEVGKIDLQVMGDADWAAFEALRQSQSPLLLQTVYGDSILEQMWVVLGPERSVTRMTVPRMQQRSYRRVSIGFTQVAQPAANPL
jgi:hypothetical protein